MEAHFEQIANELQAEQTIRDNISREVRELGVIERKLTSLLAKVHVDPNNSAETEQICSNAGTLFESSYGHWQTIRQLIGADPVEKYRGQWRSLVQNLVFLAAFRHWLLTHELLEEEETSKVIFGDASNRMLAVLGHGSRRSAPRS